MRVARNIVRTTASLLAGLAVLCAISYSALGLAGYKPFVVYSGSMAPRLAVGSLSFERAVPSSSLRRGDVVTFDDPYTPGRLVTHRIIRVIQSRQHGVVYRTKGDANPVRDPWTLHMPPRVARVSFGLPWAGYALVYARSPAGRNLAILIVLALALSSLPRRRRRRETAPA